MSDRLDQLHHETLAVGLGRYVVRTELLRAARGSSAVPGRPRLPIVAEHSRELAERETTAAERVVQHAHHQRRVELLASVVCRRRRIGIAEQVEARASRPW